MITECQIVTSSNSEEFLNMLGEAIGQKQSKGYDVEVQYKPVGCEGVEEGVIYYRTRSFQEERGGKE